MLKLIYWNWWGHIVIVVLVVATKAPVILFFFSFVFISGGTVNQALYRICDRVECEHWTIIHADHLHSKFEWIYNSNTYATCIHRNCELNAVREHGSRSHSSRLSLFFFFISCSLSLSLLYVHSLFGCGTLIDRKAHKRHGVKNWIRKTTEKKLWTNSFIWSKSSLSLSFIRHKMLCMFISGRKSCMGMLRVRAVPYTAAHMYWVWNLIFYLR